MSHRNSWNPHGTDRQASLFHLIKLAIRFLIFFFCFNVTPFILRRKLKLRKNKQLAQGSPEREEAEKGFELSPA